MELLGISDYPEIDGKSFLSAIKGNPDKNIRDRELFWHYPHYYPTTTPVSAIRQGPWKMLEYLEDGHLELYNLESDLGESKNLADSEPEKASELLEKLHHWKTEANAGKITLNPNFKNAEKIKK